MMPDPRRLSTFLEALGKAWESRSELPLGGFLREALGPDALQIDDETALDRLQAFAGSTRTDLPKPVGPGQVAESDKNAAGGDKHELTETEGPVYPAAKPLQSEQDYQQAMARLERIFTTARKGTPEGDEFEVLALLISDWEEKHHTLPETSTGDPLDERTLRWYDTVVRNHFLERFKTIRAISDPGNERESVEWRMARYALSATAEIFGPHDPCDKAEYHEICRRGELVDWTYTQLSFWWRDDPLVDYNPPVWAKLRRQDRDRSSPEPSGAMTDWSFPYTPEATEEGMILVTTDQAKGFFSTGCALTLEKALDQAKDGALDCLEFMAEECENPFDSLIQDPSAHPEARFALTDLYPIALREARNLKGYTQREMARRLGLSKSSYACLELRHAFPPEELLYRIDEVLGTRVMAVVLLQGDS